MKKVTVYTTKICGFCRHAKQLLETEGIPYEAIDLTTEPDQRMALMAKTGMRTVPQIFFGDELIGGYQELRELQRNGQLHQKLEDQISS